MPSVAFDFVLLGTATFALEGTLWQVILVLTLVEVGERFVMQFNGRRGSCTQNILKGKDLVVAVRRQVGLLLLEDGEGEYVAGEHRDKKNKPLVKKREPDDAHSLFPFHKTSLQKIYLHNQRLESKLSTS